jgi:hypothetical protein
MNSHDSAEKTKISPKLYLVLILNYLPPNVYKTSRENNKKEFIENHDAEKSLRSVGNPKRKDDEERKLLVIYEPKRMVTSHQNVITKNEYELLDG